MEIWDILDKDGNKTGKTIERGKPLKAWEFHLVIHVWILNGDGKFLISRRSPDKYPNPGAWSPTAGSAVTGEDSLSAALRETKEELGITLDPENGRLVTGYVNRNALVDVWLFRQDVDIDTVVLQQGETDDAKWAEAGEIRRLFGGYDFLHPEAVRSMEDVFRMAVN